MTEPHNTDRFTGNRWELIDQACRNAEARAARRDPSTRLIMERYCEPLSPDKKGRPQRGQLHQAAFNDDGTPIPELTHPVGSPAPYDTVKAHEERVYA